MAEQVVVPNQAGEVVVNPVPTEGSTGVEKELTLEGVNVYADVITKYKVQMNELVQAGLVSDQTATQLLVESEHSFFKQLVKVKYA